MQRNEDNTSDFGSLILHENIKTTLPKAKAMGPYVERLVTLAKKNSQCT